MRGRAVWAFCSGLCCWIASGVAHAQCTKDTDCKGDRVCEAGKCTSPLPPPPPPPPGDVAPPAGAEAPAPPPATPAGDPAAPAPVVDPPAMPVATAPVATAPVRAAPAAAVAPLRDEPRFERRSRAAMVTGIIMVSVGPIALLGALSAKGSQEKCDEDLEDDYPDRVLPSSESYRAEKCDSYTVPLYLLGIGGAVLTVGGIPLIIYGAKSVPKQAPAAKLQVAPWATPEAGGVKLRLTL